MRKISGRHLLIVYGLVMANVLYVGTANAASVRRFVFHPPATFNYGINVFGTTNVYGPTNLNGQLSLKGNALDFGRGGSQITDNGDLNIGTDNNLYLNAPTQVKVQNDLQVGGRLSFLHNGLDNGSGIVDNGDLVISSNDPIQLKTPKWVDIWSTLKLHANLEMSANNIAANTFVGNLIGNVTGDVTGNVSGNAGTVTNGVYTTGSYADPAWITSLNGSKITDGSVTTAKIADGTIVDADVNAAAAISLSKLAAGASGNIIVVNSSGVPTYVTMSGDVTNNNTGVTVIGSNKILSSMISDGTIVNADVSNTAAIAYSKLDVADGDLTIAKTSGLQTALDGKLNLSGGTMSGSINLGGNNITNGGSVTATSFSGNLTGNVTGDVTGNASTATALQTARTINGVSFDGTANITLTTADIADSVNKRYVTDAQITTLGNTSGTNSGDQDLSGLLVKANNLSDLTSALTARTNLGLGTLATQDGTFSGTSSGTNTGDQDLSGLLVKASNLSDLTDASVARTNLGLGTLATQDGTFSGTSSGTNTGDQTNITGNASTATALQTGRTINGVLFDGTANITLTTANIADSTDKRYVTDANLVLLSNTSGTNTGDQDLSGLLVKASNLSDLTNASNARTNLGLGTLATQDGTFSGTSSGSNTGDQTNITGNAGTVTNGVYDNGSYNDPTWITGLSAAKLNSGTSANLGAGNLTAASIFGNLTGNITGNAGTATALQTARTINGVPFDGTANITLTTADITDSVNKRYVTDAHLTTLGNTSGTNSGDQDLSGLLVKANNLSDLTDASVARTNLGLGTLATQSGTFSGTSSGTNTGDQTNISGNSATATTATTANSVPVVGVAPAGACSAGSIVVGPITAVNGIYVCSASSAWIEL